MKEDSEQILIFYGSLLSSYLPCNKAPLFYNLFSIGINKSLRKSINLK